MKNITPLNGNAVVKFKIAKKSGKIILPEGSDLDGSKQAEVIAVAEGSKFSAGDTVVLPNYSSRTEIKVKGEELFICPEKDFLAKIN